MYQKECPGLRSDVELYVVAYSKAGVKNFSFLCSGVENYVVAYQKAWSQFLNTNLTLSHFNERIHPLEVVLAPSVGLDKSYKLIKNKQ